MFLKFKLLDHNITGYINLGSDVSQAQDLLNMFESNVIFIEETYSNGFQKVETECSVVVQKEIKLSCKDYSDKKDVIVLSSDILDEQSVGVVLEEIQLTHDLKEVQEFYLNKLKEKDKELKKKQLEIDSLRVDLEDKLETIATLEGEE